MKFWKFDAEGEADVDQRIASGQLFPARSSAASARDPLEPHVLRSLAVGDGVVLAALVGEVGEILAIGKIVASGVDGPDDFRVHWRRVRKSTRLEQGAELDRWRTQPAFEITGSKAEALTELLGYMLAQPA